VGWHARFAQVVVGAFAAAAMLAAPALARPFTINTQGASPDIAVEKLIEAVRNPRNHRYSTSKGIPKLREAVAGNAEWLRQSMAYPLAKG